MHGDGIDIDNANDEKDHESAALLGNGTAVDALLLPSAASTVGGPLRHRRRKCHRRCQFVGGVVLAVMGVLAMLVGVALLVVVPRLLRRKLTEAIVIDSEQHSGYADFLDNAAPNAAAKYTHLNFYHMLNPHAFAYHGHAPIFQERGPYVFREHYRHHNVGFSADGTRVSFVDAVTNTFVPALSNGTLDDVVSTNKFGGESRFVEAATFKGGFVRTLKEMHTRLVPAVKASAAAKAISTGARLFGAMNGGRERLLVKMGGGCPRDASASPHAANDGSTNHDSASDDSGAPHRCNEIKTAPLTSLSFLVDVHMCDCVFCACVKEAVPLATMYRLTDPADPYSVVNATQDWGASLWLASAASSSVDDKDVHDDPIRIALQRHFSLSNYQFEHVRAWVERVAESAYLRKLVFAKLNVVPANGRARHVQSWSDLVYRQWLYADVLAVLIGAPAPILSVQESAPPEFPFYLRSPYNFDSDSSTPDGMNWSFDTVRCLEQLIPANATWTFATFLNISITLPPGMLEEFTRPSLDERTSTVTLAECFPHSIEDGVHHMAGYARYFGRTVVQAELRHVIRQLGGGLVTTRTVREHVFGFQDPLLAMVLDKDDPRYDRHALLQNDASLNEEPLCRSSADVEDDYLACQQERKVAADGQTVARRYLRVPSTFHTGKDDFDRIGTVLEHRGQRSIKGIFRRTLELDDDAASQLTDGRQRGYSVGTAFPPFGKVTAGGGVALFIGPLLSTFVYKYRETVNDLHGIDLHRFQLPDSEWTAQRSNGNLLTTTHAGLLNLTDVKAFPLYITAPHNLGFEKRFPQFGGVSAAASEQRHRSFIDIEPTTGKVMRARIQMQIAVSTNHCALDLNFPNAFKTPFLPVLWRETTSQLTDEQAQLFVSSVYGARTLSSKGVLVALCIGAIMLAMGALLARRKRRERLHRVRDGDDIDESTECLRVRDGDDGGVASGQSVQVKE